MKEWSRMTDDEKVLQWMPLFRSVAGRMKRAGADRLRDADDLCQMAVVAYISKGFPERICRDMVHSWIMDGIRKELDFSVEKRNLEVLFCDGDGDDGSLLLKILDDQRFTAYRVERNQERDPEAFARDAINRSGLSAKEKRVMRLYFIRGLKMKEIAEQVGLCDSRISQIVRVCIKKISENIQKD